ncbi:MAG: cell division protein FtsA [Lentisphaerae bacterium GWF2_44_16]|nr:MAG: cell division protein FtsA [Lentisphaerae bacterium GWF2_44_16]
MFQQRNVITGIEIGTSKICVLIGEADKNGNMVIVGHGEAPSEGAVVKGEIADMDVALDALTKAVDDADRSSDKEIDKDNIFVAVTGSNISFYQGVGTVLVRTEDRKITEEHVNEAIQSAQNNPLSSEQTAINSFDSYFLLDGVRRLRNPIEQVADKLEAYIHVIYGDRNRIRNFEELLHDVGFDEEITPVFSGVASAYGVLTDEEKANGVLIVEMGAGTTEYLAIHNYGILYSGVLPVGFEHVANDLSIGLDLHISVCRKLLLDNKLFQARMDDGKAFIDISGATAGISRKIPMNSIEKIIDLRMREVFKIIYHKLNEVNILHSLSSGAVISGGAALFPRTIDIMRNVFELPVRLGKPVDVSGAVTHIGTPRYSTVWGLLKYGDDLRRVMNTRENKSIWERVMGGFDNVSLPFMKTFSSLRGSIKF